MSSKGAVKKRRNWGGARPGAGRPKGTGSGSSPNARVHRIAVMLSGVDRKRLESLAEGMGKPLATVAYELIVRGLRSEPRRPRTP
ncbi:MAG: hypothetical protein U0900_07455 [Myxococcota bacterium]